MKRALTPLISTILLLGFAIILGSLVMSWGNSAEFAFRQCDDVAIGFTRINQTDQICYADGYFQAVLENNGQHDIRSVRVILLAENDVITVDYLLELREGEFGRLSVEGADNIQKIRIIPTVRGTQCIGQRIESDYPDRCSI